MEVEMATSVIDFVFEFLALFIVGCTAVCIAVITFTVTAMAVNVLRDDLKERKESEERKEL